MAEVLLIVLLVFLLAWCWFTHVPLPNASAHITAARRAVPGEVRVMFKTPITSPTRVPSAQFKRALEQGTITVMTKPAAKRLGVNEYDYIGKPLRILNGHLREMFETAFEKEYALNACRPAVVQIPGASGLAELKYTPIERQGAVVGVQWELV